MYLLDTNIISFSVYHPSRFPLLEPNIRATRPADRWISVITAHELIAFKYEKIAGTKSMARAPLLKTYRDLDDVLRLVCRFQIKPFDADAYDHVLGMPGHVDINDRRIAAIALLNDFTVVTHNERDFKAIKRVKPKLRFEDWAEQAMPSVGVLTIWWATGQDSRRQFKPKFRRKSPLPLSPTNTATNKTGKIGSGCLLCPQERMLAKKSHQYRRWLKAKRRANQLRKLQEKADNNPAFREKMQARGVYLEPSKCRTDRIEMWERFNDAIGEAGRE